MKCQSCKGQINIRNETLRSQMEDAKTTIFVAECESCGAVYSNRNKELLIKFLGGQENG